jgi:hypothetical protein
MLLSPYRRFGLAGFLTRRHIHAVTLMLPNIPESFSLIVRAPSTSCDKNENGVNMMLAMAIDCLAAQLKVDSRGSGEDGVKWAGRAIKSGA